MALPKEPVPFGQYLVNEVLPPELRDYTRTLDKKAQNKVLTEVANKYPEQYKDVAFAWSQIGREISPRSGGFSPSAQHLQTMDSAKQIRKEFIKQRNAIIRNKRLSEDDKKALIVEAAFDASEKQRDAVYNEALEKKNPFALQAHTGARGNKGNVNSLVGSDYLYVDSKGNPIPFAVLHSYGEGLRPTEYWAGAYGARKGVIDPKLATRNAGFLCLDKNTEIRMADFTTKAIQDIKVGDWVLGVATDTMQGEPVEVTAVFDNGVRDCWRTEFNRGAERESRLYLESTLDHKVYGEIRDDKVVTEYGEDGTKRKVHKITYIRDTHPIGCNGNFGALPLNSTYSFSGIAEPYAFLLGLLIGDGSVTNTKNNREISLCCFDTVLLDYLFSSDYLESLYLKLAVKDVEKGQYILRDKTRQTQNIKQEHGVFLPGLKSTLKLRLQEFGLLGCYSHNKVIPKEAYSWDKQSLAELISGYFAADGSIHLNRAKRQQPMISFGSTSRVLLEQLKDLLEVRFGILCSKVYKSSYGERHGTRSSYMLVICRRQDVRQFFAEIPIRGIKKQQFESLLNMFQGEQRDKRKFYRRSQAPLGKRQTFDIEVNSPNHLFVLANGLIVSNSKQLVAMANRGIISALDADEQNEDRGLPVSVDDEDSIGALLARSVGGYARNTRITSKILNDLKRQKIDDILIRSPIVGGSPEGSLYARDVGYREKGRLPVVGENPSVTAVQAIGEPIGQGALCLSGDTAVRMANGLTKHIRDIVPGDVVLGSDKEGLLTPVKVINKFENGIKRCYRFQYSLYTEGIKVSVVCTEDHKFLKASGRTSKYIPSIVPTGVVRDLLAFRKPGANILTASFIPYSVKSVTVENLETFDIEVDNKDHLFVLGNGLICSNSCLEEGTPVRMADGSVRKIEEIEPGEQVIGVSDNGELAPTTVVNLFDTGRRDCYNYGFLNLDLEKLDYVCCTPEHKFKTIEHGKLPVSETCTKAFKVLAVDNETNIKSESLVTEAIYIGKRPTYDIEVDNESHLFLLANGLVCSNSKHLGGVASKGGNAVSGFKAINQLLQVPKIYTGGATHSEIDGFVSDIVDAPQGGKYIVIDGTEHYVSPGMEPLVKVGDDIEAGDVLSEGLPNPAMVVKHKGIGEGRRYFTDVFKKAIEDSGLSVHRRNVELLARGAVNHVRLTKEYENYLPDDVIPYNLIESRYKPRVDAREMGIKSARNKYLEKPVLHYSIGTQLKPSMIERLKKFGIENVHVHDEPPPFMPEMERGMANISHDPDFFVGMGGSGIKRRLMKAVHRGESSNLKGTSFIPGVAFDQNFGAKGTPLEAPINTLKNPRKLSDFM